MPELPPPVVASSLFCWRRKMKHKRLTRDGTYGWGFDGYPYVQTRIESPDFCGLAALLTLAPCKSQYWYMPKAGRICVTGPGVRWLQLIPDGKKRVITAVFLPDGKLSIWYVDVTDGWYLDTDGVPVFIDKYLDVIFSPEGDMKVDDRDELDAAYAKGELSRAQYEQGIAEGEAIQRELCADLAATEALCRAVLARVEQGTTSAPPLPGQ